MQGSEVFWATAVQPSTSDNDPSSQRHSGKAHETHRVLAYQVPIQLSTCFTKSGHWWARQSRWSQLPLGNARGSRHRGQLSACAEVAQSCVTSASLSRRKAPAHHKSSGYAVHQRVLSEGFAACMLIARVTGVVAQPDQRLVQPDPSRTYPPQHVQGTASITLIRLSLGNEAQSNSSQPQSVLCRARHLRRLSGRIRLRRSHHEQA